MLAVFENLFLSLFGGNSYVTVYFIFYHYINIFLKLHSLLIMAPKEVPFLVNIVLQSDETKNNVNLTPEREQTSEGQIDIEHDYKADTVGSSIVSVAKILALINNLFTSQTDFRV